jgi:hypothetical protein
LTHPVSSLAHFPSRIPSTLFDFARSSAVERFKGAPYPAPHRLDDTRAQRAPTRRWAAPVGHNMAAA